MIREDGYKICGKCKQWMCSKTNFYKGNKPTKNNPDGLSSYCKACVKEKVAEWEKKNPNKVKESKARRELSYRTKHPGKAAELQRSRRKNNPEKFALWQKNYNQSEQRKESQRQRQNLRKAFKREKLLIGDDAEKISLQDWNNLLAAFGNACCFCGSCEKITIDHLTPLCRGKERNWKSRASMSRL